MSTAITVMHTINEARQKCCPLMGRGGGIKCVGDACMLWRYSVALHDGPDSYIAEPGPVGYCGLAREPLT